MNTPSPAPLQTHPTPHTQTKIVRAASPSVQTTHGADARSVSKPNGSIVERPRYTSYGVPRTAAVADFNHDGFIDDADFAIFSASYGALVVDYSPGSATTRGDEAWAVCDLNMDGVVDDDDFGLFSPHYEDVVGVSGGHLSDRADLQNVRGWSGQSHVLNGSHIIPRHRVFYAQAGTWTTHDGLRYADGMNVFEYVRSSPVRDVDPSGLNAIPVSLPRDGDHIPPWNPYASYNPSIDPFVSPPPGFMKECPGTKHKCRSKEETCSPWTVVIRGRPRVTITHPQSMELTDHKGNMCADRSTKCFGSAVARTVEARVCRSGADCTGSGEFAIREYRHVDSPSRYVSGAMQPVGPWGQCLCVLSPGIPGGERGYPLGNPPDWDIPWPSEPSYPLMPPPRAPGICGK